MSAIVNIGTRKEWRKKKCHAQAENLLFITIISKNPMKVFA